MNARQKAKYYRRKYEELANMPLPKPAVTKYKVDTLKIQRLYPPGDLIVNGMKDEIKNIIARDLVDSLASQMDKYVTVEACFDPCLYQYRFAGKVKVVRAESEVEKCMKAQ